MAVSHVKSDTIADFTGTITGFNSQGSTTTIVATDLVRPSDWNSAHNQFYTLAGNTNNASTASGTNVVFSAAGNLTIAGSTGTIVFSGAARESGHAPYGDYPLVAGQVGNGTVQVAPHYFPNLEFDRLVYQIINTNSSNSSGSHSLSFWAGVYTRNNSSISLLSSTSTSTALTHSGTAGSYSFYSGIRHMTIPWTGTFTEGKYWVAFASRTSSGGANGTYSNLVVSNVSSNFLGYFGSSHATTVQMTLGQGVYTTTSAGLPDSVAFTQIRGSDSAGLRFPNIYFASSTI